MWRNSTPLFHGDVTQANVRLDQIVQSAMNRRIQQADHQQVVSSDRDQIRDILIAAANPQWRKATRAGARV